MADVRRRCMCGHGTIQHHPARPFACTVPGCECNGYVAHERRGRARRVIPRGGRRLEDLMKADDGPPFTPPEAARLATLSETQIRREIEAGELKAVTFGLGRKARRRLIPWRELKAYLLRIGILPVKSDAA